MNKLLIVCGPTATGKTKIAIELAKKFHGDLINADSRQIYKGLPILTGKDIPKNATYKKFNDTTLSDGRSYTVGYWEFDDIRLWMTDIVDLESDFSVAQYASLTQNVIQYMYSQNTLPIIVGGTGLYIRAVTHPFETVQIPRNENLREALNGLTVDDLKQELARRNEKRFQEMNASDKENPRRLIRAIEIHEWQSSHAEHPLKMQHNSHDIYTIGLNGTLQTIESKIYARIRERWNSGVIDEVRDAMSLSASQASTAIGFSCIKSFLQHTLDEESAKRGWLQDELLYAKRQRTWFKKEKEIKWFSIDDPFLSENIQRNVAAWYTQDV